jgi:hypothetical protein
MKLHPKLVNATTSGRVLAISYARSEYRHPETLQRFETISSLGSTNDTFAMPEFSTHAMRDIKPK